MICPNCGAEVDDTAQKCFLCDYLFEEAEASESQQSTPLPEDAQIPEHIPQPESGSTPQKTEKKPKETGGNQGKNQTGLFIAITIFLCVLLVILIIAIFYVLQMPEDNESQQTAAAPVASTDVTTDTTTSTTTAPTTTTAATTTTTTIASTEPPTEAPENLVDYVAAYGSWVEFYAADARELPNSKYFYGYTLYDINGDGVLELIVKTGTCEADAAYEVYTLDDRIVYHCGTVDAPNAILEEADGVLYMSMGAQHYQTIDTLSLQGDALRVSTYFDSGDEMVDNYITVGNTIKMSDIYDTFLLEQESTTTVAFGYYDVT